jgi:hypothetical protein
MARWGSRLLDPKLPRRDKPAIIEQVFLAGLQVPDARVLELARRLTVAGFYDLGDRLEDAWRRDVKVLGLDVADREAILRVLEDGACSFRSEPDRV